ncbi:MAG TPA: hypothetical protein VMC82_01165 [Thermoplasmata archaeon]|nr:hypothetical protein [Thermoplasmata archaeon]
MSATLHPHDVLLFVKSERTIRLILPEDAHDHALEGLRQNGVYTFVPGTYAGHSGGAALWSTGEYAHKPVEGEDLPEDEEEAVRRAGALVMASGRTVHVVDVGKETAFHRVISEHLHHLRKFPVLCRPDGRRLEGVDAFTEDNLRRILAD